MVTMSDIAARVGVSQATVSYVLSGRRSGVRVRDEMRQRILQTAAELGYRRNDLARAMASGKNYVLGFVTRIAGQESSARMMVGAQEEAGQRGYSIRMMPMTGNPDYSAAFASLAEQRVAGVFAVNLKVDTIECLRQETERFEIPVVLLDDPPALDWGIRVVGDDPDGMRQALEHLLALGHRRIGFVSAQDNSPLSINRHAIFVRLMQERGLPLPDHFQLWTDWLKPEKIEPPVRALLASGRPADSYPTALMCAGDHIAMVTMRTAREVGFHVPRDLSVVGFANFISAVFVDPPLTTIAQPYEDMGKLGARCLLDGPESVPGGEQVAPGGGHDILVPTKLIVRASTADVPTAGPACLGVRK